jgi:hypothetical protein
VGRITVIAEAKALITAIIVCAVPVTYAQNKTTTLATNYTSLTTPSIAGINATAIINAINAKLKLTYDEKSYNAMKPSR